jgi:flagellar basal body P-ring formation protein FlgA
MGLLGQLTVGLLSISFSISSAWADSSNAIRALPVPASAIPAGHVISSADLTERKFHTTSRSLSGIAITAVEIEGMEARRRLQAGKPIPVSALTKPISVRRGMKVTASYVEDGLSISTQLVALDDGSKGDVIPLRNSATGAVVNAEIKDDGRLAVRAE